MPVLDTFHLADRVAVVTGVNRGLGKAFATALGEAGATVAILARDSAATTVVVQDLTARGITTKGYEADVVNRADVDRALGEIVTDLGRVDILVNNAGA